MRTQHEPPELESYCGSWIIVSRATGKPVLETFERSTAKAINQAVYEVLTAMQWLARFNSEVKLKEREKKEMEEDIACSQWTTDAIEATQNPEKLKEFRAKYGEKGLPPKNVVAASLGRLGGSVKSEARSTSSRENGRKGGRPRSTQSIDMEDI